MQELETKNKIYEIATNSLIRLDDVTFDYKGKGHKFVSRFIEAGIAHYSDLGDVLITKETLDKFINTMVGCPVIINHQDITDNNVDKERVGVISNVWYNPNDGWFYCDGVIWDKQAIDLIKNEGWNVSCAYSFKSDKKPVMYHGKKVDMEFTDGDFQHLAIVKVPRYENANIVVNSKEFDESKHPRDEQGKFTNKLDDNQSKELGVALYTVNKEAKKYRDLRDDLKSFLFETRPLSEESVKTLNKLYPDYDFDEKGVFVEDEYGKRYHLEDEIDEEIRDNKYYQLEDWEDDNEELENLKDKINFNLHDVLKELPTEQYNLYDLKQEVIEKYQPETLGIHRFGDDTARKLYKIGDFTFHGNDISKDLTMEQYKALEKLETISSENKLLEDDKIDIDTAKYILKKYVSNSVVNNVFNGGEGSGDFDHAGRPPKVGGSEPAGTGRKGKYKDGKQQWIGKKPESKENTEKESDTYKSRFENIRNLTGTISKDDKHFESKYRTAETRLKDKIEHWQKDAEDEKLPATKKIKERNVEIAKEELKKLQALKSAPAEKSGEGEGWTREDEKQIREINKQDKNSGTEKQLSLFDKGFKQENKNKLKKVEIEKPKEVNKNQGDIKILKETKKAVLINKDGTELWIPKRFYKNGEFTPKGKELFEDKVAENKALAKLEKTGIEFEPSYESEKAYGVDSTFEGWDDKLHKVRVFIPKSQLNKKGNIPLWLYKKKLQEINEKVGFRMDKGNYGTGFKTDFYRDKPILNSDDKELYTILDGELYLITDDDITNVKNNIDNKERKTIMAVLNELKDFVLDIVRNEKDDKRAGIDKVAGIMKSAGCDDEDIRTAIGIMEKVAYDKSEAGTADNKKDVKNAKVCNEDKRKLIDEIGGILKSQKVGDEVIRTVIKKAEELSYEPSEDDKADNCRGKAKNAETEEKKEEKEIGDVKNSMDDLRQAVYGGVSASETPLYLSQADRIELGNNY